MTNQVIPAEARPTLLERVLRRVAWGLFIIWAILAIATSAWQAYKVVWGGGM